MPMILVHRHAVSIPIRGSTAPSPHTWNNQCFLHLHIHFTIFLISKWFCSSESLLNRLEHVPGSFICWIKSLGSIHFCMHVRVMVLLFKKNCLLTVKRGGKRKHGGIFFPFYGPQASLELNAEGCLEPLCLPLSQFLLQPLRRQLFMFSILHAKWIEPLPGAWTPDINGFSWIQLTWPHPASGTPMWIAIGNNWLPFPT